MAQATLSYVNLSSIEPNPFRDLKTYPYSQQKLEALMRSIEDVGLWEGMLGRRHGNGYQLAFAHHRLEAARKKKLNTVPLIIRDLTDEQMIMLMGRENMEDYNSDFLVMLAAWESAVKFRRESAGNVQDLDIAALLGWTRKAEGSGMRMNETAQACANASKLIAGGHIERKEFAELPVTAVREICGRVVAQQEMLEKLGKMGNRPAAEIERDKKAIGRAGKAVAKGYREGNISQKNIRSEITNHAVKGATAKGKVSPLFAAFAKEVAESIHKMLVSDSVATRLGEMEKALPHVVMDEDRAALRRIDFALAEHVETSANWRGRLTPKGRRVVPFKLLKKEETR